MTTTVPPYNWDPAVIPHIIGDPRRDTTYIIGDPDEEPYTLCNDSTQCISLVILAHNLEYLQFLLFGTQCRYKKEVATT